MAEDQTGVLRWRRAVASEHGPDPRTRHVLLTLSVWMDGDGFAFPGTRKLAKATGLSRPTVMKYLDRADEGGWIERKAMRDALEAWPIRVPEGFNRQAWKLTAYRATVPDVVKPGVDHVNPEGGKATVDHVEDEAGQAMPLPRSGEGGQKTGRTWSKNGPNVVKPRVDQKRLKSNSTSTTEAPPSASPPDSELSEGELIRAAIGVWEDRYGEGTAHGGRIGKAVKALAKHHPHDSILSAWTRYVSETPGKYASPQRFRSTFKDWTKPGGSTSGGYQEHAADGPEFDPDGPWSEV